LLTKSLLYSAVIAIAFPLWPLLWSFTVADQFERKWQIVGASGAAAILGLIFSFQSSPELLIFFGVLMKLVKIVDSRVCLHFSQHADGDAVDRHFWAAHGRTLAGRDCAVSR
jgi:putative MFS transporter